MRNFYIYILTFISYLAGFDNIITDTTINAKKSHKESKVNDYPYFSVAFDFRHPLDYILVAIEHKRKAFANIKTVADGLKEYFNRSIKDFEVKLRPASFSKVFCKRI